MPFELNKEQILWRNTIHDFVAKEVKPKAKEVDEKAEFNWPATKKMGPLGLLGLNIPEEFGGSGVDAVSAAVAIEQLGWACGSTALAISAHNALACAPIANFASDDLRNQWLPNAASGKGQLATLALTEAGAGTDLQGGVRTTAKLVGDHWLINGNKIWCTNASIADFIVTLVRTNKEENSTSLSLIVVPTNSKGLSIGPAEKKMGLNGSPTHAVAFTDVQVPADQLVGEEGQGLQYTLATLDGGRIGIGALAIGLAQAALDEALKYAQERKTFGRPIASNQAIQWMLANAETNIHAARLMVYRAAELKEMGKPFSKDAAMAKLFATEMAEQVCRDAIQIHGGYGYSREFPVERIYRDVRLMTIGEGTSEVQRMVIARHLLS